MIETGLALMYIGLAINNDLPIHCDRNMMICKADQYMDMSNKTGENISYVI